MSGFATQKMLKSLVILSLVFCGNNGLDAPIIGILAQESYIVSHLIPKEEYGVNKSFIAASYVKYLESAGAKVVPVWIGQSDDYYRNIVNYTNGILFPGGGTYFNETGGYGEAALKVFQEALDANDRGIYYPIWGSCLGMQVLPFATLNGTDIRVDCNLHDKAIPLNIPDGAQNSKLFRNASADIVAILRSRNVTYNNHRYCLTKKVLEDNKILSDWRILTTNEDIHRVEFISSMESPRYPFYGVQFHPEKNQFEFKKKGIPHGYESVRISQYFSNFFVDECRKNNNTFPSSSVEDKSLIYNYNPSYTGNLRNSSYEQIYFFDPLIVILHAEFS